MSDERNPNNGLGNFEGNRAGARTASGRFPAINAGRGAAGGQGRFSQAAMPAVGRAGAAVPPPAPVAPEPSPAAVPPAVPTGRPGAAPAGRGGRPGMVGRGGGRPTAFTPEIPAADPVVTHEPPAVSAPKPPVGRAPAAKPPVRGASPVHSLERPHTTRSAEELPAVEAPVAAPVLEEAHIAEPAPVIEPAPVVVEEPVVEQAPVVEEEPIVEQAPVVKEEPVVEQAPVVEEEPVVEQAPVVEEEPVVEPAPVVEEEPVVEQAPVVEEEPVVEPAPVVEEEPVVEPAPVVEEEPVVEETSDSEEGQDSLLMMEAPSLAPATEVAKEEIDDSNDSYYDDDSKEEAVEAQEDEDDLAELALKDANQDKGPAFEIKPIPPELKHETYLRDNGAYRRESRSLLRSQSWTELVQMMQNVLMYAPWADLPEVRSSILKELAGIFGDKLNDAANQKETFIQLLREDPSNESALEFMENIHRANGDFIAIHTMYRKVVDAVWESDERLFYTQKAVDIAQHELNKPSLVIADWEHLWSLGEHGEDVQNAMMAAYRETGSWEKLAHFIREKCVDWGILERLGLREVIEIYISGLNDADRARETLNVLLKKRPKDPLLLLQQINICRINGDIDNLAKISRMSGLDKTVELDIHRAAADVLWDKGEYDLAVEAYDAILEELPDDRDALHAREQYFILKEMNEQLCEFYRMRADTELRKGAQTEAIELLKKAADVAEKKMFDNELAICVLKSVIDIDPNDIETHQRVIALYEAIGDEQNVADSMEALLALTSRPAMKREILAKLGSFYLDKLENYERAEACWKKVQAFDPGNSSVSEELSRVYAKKGDFEALDNSLTHQIRFSDDETILSLAESKGRYLMQHSPESAHTAAGWEIVLDCSPNNSNALENLSSVLEKLNRNIEMIGAWEHELRSVKDPEEKISLGLRIADACVESESHAQAVSAYLRVLCWEPTQESALRALETICTENERAIVLSVLEVAAIMTEDLAKRCNLLKTSLRFIPKTNIVQRIQTMRRLIIMGDNSILNDFVQLCRQEKQSDELCAAWLRRAYEVESAEEREALLSDVARFNIEDLDNASLAFTILFSAALESHKAKALADELERLAPQTNRWEEVVAVLGCITTAQFDENERKEALRKRIGILLDKLNDPRRALEDYRRLLAMNPEDTELLSDIECLASDKGLHEQLLGVYGELWDRTNDIELRSEIAEKCFRILKRELSRDYDALSELFIAWRLQPSNSLQTKLFAETENDEVASLCVSMLEGNKRAAEKCNVDDFKAIANIYENRLADIDGAFYLYTAVLITDPNDEEALNKLSLWAEAEDRYGRYAQTLRIAASTAHSNNDIEKSLELYRLLANFYKNKLNDLERSVDVERTILHIDPNCIESLETLIAWHDSRQEWPQLCSELKQRIAAGGTKEEKIDLWLRIVALCTEHLNDIEGAFDGYAEILQLDENNQAARDGLAAITGAGVGPEVELRCLKLELKLASDEKRPEIMLKIAELQSNQLSQTDAACETLENLYKLTGPCGIGYEPLRAAYEKSKSWSGMLQIMTEHADALIENEEIDDAVDVLNEALSIADKKLGDEKLSASIVEKLQTLEPDNEEIVERYCSGLRNAENWVKYAETTKNLAGDIHSKNVHKSHLFELARIQALALNDFDAAIETYKVINKHGTPERNALFGLASVALKKGDIELYMSSIESVLKLVDPVWGAIFYCHLAEVSDEKDMAAQVATYYRNARMLDANNVEASDSLRSIGRRLKNWRSTSALLPVENEREMSWADRSAKLVEMSKKAGSNDKARIWLWKAIAVNHDNINAWHELAVLEEKAGHLKERYEACLGAYGAVERTTLPGPSVALQNAKLMYEVSLAASACGNEVRGEALLRKAYSMAPTYAPVAIAIGDMEQDSGNLDKAYAIYDAILKNDKTKVDDKTKGEILFKRGLIANIKHDYAQALDDLRATVKISPLHYDALMTISKTYAEMKQPLLALACLQQSLLVTPDHTKRRGNTYYDMGKLWADIFNDSEEAGIYYEGALKNGASNVDLIERSLEIYKQAGRYKDALELVDTLTKTTSNPSILASLWCTRGELSESISTEQATEAYDMALSYQPGMGRAFDGLERMLVVRKEWNQLAELLDGRLEGDISKDQEAAILLRLADLYGNQLNEPKKAAGILYRLLDNSPSAQVIERLLAMPQDDEVKRRSLLEKAIIYCTGSYNYALELAKAHLNAGRELQAWAIMSPLRTLLQLDAQTKETLNDLKNKFEKTESISPNTLAKALPILSDEQFAILDAIQTVNEKLGTLGATNLNDVTSGATEVSDGTPNGKIFHQMRTGLGLENIVLYRAAELPETIVVLNTNPVVVCIRTEIFQKAAGNELQFWLAKSLGLAHPDVRILASTPENMRTALPKAVLVAAGIGNVTDETAILVSKIKACMSEDELKALHTQLSIYEDENLLKCAETFTTDMLASSDLLGAYVVADMRTVWRAESRIDTNITEQRNVKTIEEISKAIEVSDILRKVLAYYVSEAFTEHIG